MANRRVGTTTKPFENGGVGCGSLVENFQRERTAGCRCPVRGRPWPVSKKAEKGVIAKQRGELRDMTHPGSPFGKEVAGAVALASCHAVAASSNWCDISGRVVSSGHISSRHISRC